LGVILTPKKGLKKHWRNEYNPSIQKVRNAVKMFDPLNVGHVQTLIL